jgi:hypothetical protein
VLAGGLDEDLLRAASWWLALSGVVNGRIHGADFYAAAIAFAPTPRATDSQFTLALDDVRSSPPSYR